MKSQAYGPLFVLALIAVRGAAFSQDAIPSGQTAE